MILCNRIASTDLTQRRLSRHVAGHRQYLLGALGGLRVLAVAFRPSAGCLSLTGLSPYGSLTVSAYHFRGAFVRRIELLAPARDLETGIAAIDCGADAVYIGAPRFGARETAGNPVADLEKLARHAHKYWARVYVTLNTLLTDEELPEAVRLAHQVCEIGADALIIQDTGLVECDLPSIPLFASTQMHNSTPEKIAFLERVGFRRAILARELSLEQIQSIRSNTSIELEAFVHGALCVCYSGQCYLSYAFGGRSGNRGECAQPCRRSYTLVDAGGRAIARTRHLLSVRDLNLTGRLRALLDAGVSSFKIEGRLKDKPYVMNVVAHYRRELDRVLRHSEEVKSSSGNVQLDFEPDLNKTFNRGYTSWFVTGSREKMGSIDSPKMIGEPVGTVSSAARDSFVLSGTLTLHNGDGIAFYNDDGELDGTLVNRVERNVIHPARMDGLRNGRVIYRNHDRKFFVQLERSRVRRRIGVRVSFSAGPRGCRLTLCDEDGVSASKDADCPAAAARNPDTALAVLEKQLCRLGDTEFICSAFEPAVDPVPFLPVSALNELRRGAVDALREARRSNRPVLAATVRPNDDPYPEKDLSFLGNVLNSKAAAFYRRHGVSSIEPAAESGLDMRGRTVMTAKYCLKYELDACPRAAGAASLDEPLHLQDESGRRLGLKFDCARCCMEVIYLHRQP